MLLENNIESSDASIGFILGLQDVELAGELVTAAAVARQAESGLIGRLEWPAGGIAPVACGKGQNLGRNETQIKVVVDGVEFDEDAVFVAPNLDRSGIGRERKRLRADNVVATLAGEISSGR
jgi:hypothetical protein